MNLNKLARYVTLKEKGKKQISIAQVKEVMKIIFIKLSKEKIEVVEGILKRYKKRK